MIIRKTTEADIETILHIHQQAFGEKEGPEIGTLVHDVFNDPTARPLLSLLALERERAVGHILFTHVRLHPDSDNVSAQILAPLAVLPEFQSQGIGGRLIKEGLRHLQESGVQLVFVLGHPGYYPRFGFQPAGKLGYEAPYAIPAEHAEAWMVQELCSGVIGRVAGKVQCCAVLNQPQYWRE